MIYERKKFNWQKIKENSEFKDNFVKRGLVIKYIREYFDNLDFVEVQTPKLVKLPGMEPYLNPFKTQVVDCDGNKEDAYLITSPEYCMKKLLCAGFDKIYEITSSFRNCEDKSELHNTEFTIMEWYRANADYNALMTDVENMIYQVNLKLNKRNYIIINNKKIDLTPPWPRKTVAQLFHEYLGLDLNLLLTDKAEFVKLAKAKGHLVEEDEGWEDIFYKLFLTNIENNLGNDKPVFVIDYPAAMAALARLKPDDKRWAERVEFYIAGIELGNGFSELTDAKEQELRLTEERELRKQLGKDVYDVDKTFIDALAQGMPPSTGIAVGIDRIVLLLLEKENIEDVILFPQKEFFDFK